MDILNQINNTSVYRNPAPQSPLQGQNVLQPASVYSKIMLRTIELTEKDFVFDGLAIERNMPSNNGANEITFKRMMSLAAHTQPLVEGIPPASDEGRMVAIKASTKSYGRVMKFTDKVNWAVVDSLISEYTRQLALKIPETKDILAQEAMLAECQLFYASEKERNNSNDADILVPKAGGDVKHYKYIHPDCAPTIDEFRKIVLSMESAKVRPYQGENFLALISSAVLFDLITDKRVKEFMKYTNSGSAYSNDAVIDLFSLAFKKAKTIKSDNTYVDGDGNVCYIYHAPSFKGITGNGAATAFTGPANIVIKNNTIASVAAEDTTLAAEIIPLTKGANFSYTVAKYNLVGGRKAIETATSGIYDVLNVHTSFVIGEECLARIGVEGHTSPAFISKPLGSGGTEDPLNQRQSVGWKIDSLGYKVLNPDAVVQYLSCPTQYKINMNARPDLKNQFTEYNYGYQDASGRYFHPEQVMQTVESGAVVYYVRGTTTKVNPVTMTKLVQPINGGRIDDNGKNQVIHGNLPTTAYALKSNHAVTFMKDQVVKHTDSKFYIKGLAGVATAEVIELPATVTKSLPKADGSAMEDVSVTITGDDVNKTGDPSIDG